MIPQPSTQVSVVIPCFNDASTILEAIASVRQGQDPEVIVVDDGSSDSRTLALLDELPALGIRVIRQRNQGSSAARMAGVAASSGRYIVPLDADDRLTPGALERMAQHLDENERLAAVWGDVLVAGDLRYVRQTARALDPWLVTFVNDQPGAGSMVRRAILLEVGGWSPPDPARPNCYWDWNFWMTLAERGYNAGHVGGITLEYSVRTGAGRVNETCRSAHAPLYEALRAAHPQLFATRRANARASLLPPAAKACILALDSITALPRGVRGRLAVGVCQLALGRGGYMRPVVRFLRSKRPFGGDCRTPRLGHR